MTKGFEGDIIIKLTREGSENITRRAKRVKKERKLLERGEKTFFKKMKKVLDKLEKM